MPQLTAVEQLFDQAVLANTPILPIDESCEAMIVSGPTRLSTQNPQEVRALASTGLSGFSTKNIVVKGIAATPVAITVAQANATDLNVGVIVSIMGAPNVFRRPPIKLTISATSGMTQQVVWVYPKKTRAQFLLITTRDNGGVGQVSVAAQISVAFDTNDYPNIAASEFSLATESINLRDFTNRNG